MKLTLRAARKLEGKIANRINEGIDHDVTFSAYDKSPVSEKLTRAQNGVRVEVDTILALTNIRADIRRSIQTLNEESGINGLVSDRKKALDILAIWKDIKATGDNTRDIVTTEIIEGKLEAIRTSTNNASSYSARDSVTVRAVSDEFVEEAAQSISALESRIEGLDDAILETNMGTKVTLADTDVNLLRKLGLL